jgi:hypothetical protein
MTNLCTFFTSHDQAMEGAKMAGASRIIGVDLNPEKYEQGTVCLMEIQGCLVHVFLYNISIIFQLRNLDALTS